MNTSDTATFVAFNDCGYATDDCPYIRMEYTVRPLIYVRLPIDQDVHGPWVRNKIRAFTNWAAGRGVIESYAVVEIAVESGAPPELDATFDDWQDGSFDLVLTTDVERASQLFPRLPCRAVSDDELEKAAQGPHFSELD